MRHQLGSRRANIIEKDAGKDLCEEIISGGNQNGLGRKACVSEGIPGDGNEQARGAWSWLHLLCWRKQEGPCGWTVAIQAGSCGGKSREGGAGRGQFTRTWEARARDNKVRPILGNQEF